MLLVRLDSVGVDFEDAARVFGSQDGLFDWLRFGDSVGNRDIGCLVRHLRLDRLAAR